MISAKALCVVFLLYSTFNKSQSLEDISSSVKRTNSLNNVNQNAGEIAQTIKEKLRMPDGKFIGQNAYMYLQPTSTQEVTYDNEEVKKTFEQTAPYQLPARVWPERKEESNFRMAVPDRKAKLHAEIQLLENDGLQAMIVSYMNKEPKPTSCPQYLIFYSMLLPCMSCADELVAASEEHKTKSICKGTPFYLNVGKPDYTHDPKEFNKIRAKLIDPKTGIIWSNDPGPRPTKSTN